MAMPGFKGTPGPWELNAAERGSFLITSKDKIAIVHTFEPKQSMRKLVGADNPFADARLIAAALDLLEVAKLVDEFATTDEHCGDQLLWTEQYQTMVEITRVAIAKALGSDAS